MGKYRIVAYMSLFDIVLHSSASLQTKERSMSRQAHWFVSEKNDVSSWVLSFNFNDKIIDQGRSELIAYGLDVNSFCKK